VIMVVVTEYTRYMSSETEACYGVAASIYLLVANSNPAYPKEPNHYNLTPCLFQDEPLRSSG
jgi:hypothetical protein